MSSILLAWEPLVVGRECNLVVDPCRLGAPTVGLCDCLGKARLQNSKPRLKYLKPGDNRKDSMSAVARSAYLVSMTAKVMV